LVGTDRLTGVRTTVGSYCFNWRDEPLINACSRRESCV